MEDTIITSDDDKSYQQITWISLIKSWAMLFFICISAVTLLVVLVAGVRVMVWRARGDGAPLLQSPATPTLSPSPPASLALPSPSPMTIEFPPGVLPSPGEASGVTSIPSPSVSPAVTPTIPLSLSFRLIIPVGGVRPEQLRDTYTDARSEGRLHNAIDIMAARGTPVVAATDGHIVRLFSSDRGGITIYQFSPDQKAILYYAHLDHYADGLIEGKSVQKGETIAYVGDTGNASRGSYHLHFAIWLITDPKHYWNGETINPYPLLRYGN